MSDSTNIPDYIMTSNGRIILFFVNSGTFVGPNRTCLGEFGITMESGLFLDSQVDVDDLHSNETTFQCTMLW
jgi:hypothetical protein